MTIPPDPFEAIVLRSMQMAEMERAAPASAAPEKHPTQESKPVNSTAPQPADGHAEAQVDFAYTVFATVSQIKACERVASSWPELVGRIVKPTVYKQRDDQPLLKLAEFGDARTDKGSLRHDGNVGVVYGLEGDYDDEQVTPAEAARLLAAAGIRAVVYTSSSHGTVTKKSKGGPRWRVLAPLSAPVAPEWRAEYMDLLNGALGGILATESWTLSQTYYFGHVEGVPYEAHEVEGECLDVAAMTADIMPTPARVKVKPAVALEKPRNIGDIDDPALPYIEGLGIVKGYATDGKVHVECPWSGEHTGPDMSPSTTSYFPRGLGGEAEAGFRCMHSHCQGRNGFDFLRKIGFTERDVAAEFPDADECEAMNRAHETAQKVIDRARIEAERREHQRREARLIGEGELKVPQAQIIDLPTALRRFVFLSDGSRVADIFNPHFDLALPDWANTFSASHAMVKQKPKEMRDGKLKGMPDKRVAVSELWKASPKRRTAVCRTFMAGGALVLPDPDGRLALNSWRPFDRSVEVSDIHAAGVGLFLDHVEFLFAADAGRFLDWLAHIEQRPGELPHTAWLHIADRFGLGRNWLGSLLARVWAGSVAVNLDLPALLASGFNGRLSRKVLAVVDEIREGGRDTQWEHSERLKSLITEEVRRINPKYGRETVEHNSCRWLMFSNHVSALPLEQGDRRVEVVRVESTPRGADYYSRLYAALSDRQFVAAVAKYLGQRDLSAFNPGAHAKLTDAKRTATQASQSPLSAAAELIVQHWPCDVATSSDLAMAMGVGFDGARVGMDAARRRALEQAGVEPVGRAVKVDKIPRRLSIIRNKAKWRNASGAELAAECAKGIKALDGETNPADYLMQVAADTP